MDDTTQRKRALAGRVLLENRAAPTAISKVGGNMCTVAGYTPKPAYPAGYQITSAEAQPTSSMVAFFSTGVYWAVPTVGANCAAPGWVYRNTAQVLVDGYQIGGKGKKTVNVDHVCK